MREPNAGDLVVSLIAALPTVALLGSHVKKLVTNYFSRQQLKPTINLNTSNVDPIYFEKTRLVESVEIRNFQKIKHLDLSLIGTQTTSSPWTMLLGENGVGKSSILQAIGLALIEKRYIKKLALEPESFITNGAEFATIEVRFSNFPKPVTLRIDPVDGFTGSIGSAKVLILGYGATRLMPRQGMANVTEANYGKLDN